VTYGKVMAALGALVAVGFVIVAVAILTRGSKGRDSEGIECATGDLAMNPRNFDGSSRPRAERFDEIEKAEAFLCIDLPELREQAGWRLRFVEASRSKSLDESGRNDDIRRGARIEYYNEALGSFIGLIPFMPGVLNSPGSCTLPGPPSRYEIKTVSIHGQEARLYRETEPVSQPNFAICWESNGLTIYAGGSVRRNVDLIATFCRYWRRFAEQGSRSEVHIHSAKDYTHHGYQSPERRCLFLRLAVTTFDHVSARSRHPL
jgi:hypothetical protein